MQGKSMNHKDMIAGGYTLEERSEDYERKTCIRLQSLIDAHNQVSSVGTSLVGVGG